MTKLLQEFSELAVNWFNERHIVKVYYDFFQNFFKPENLKSAEWPDFQRLAEHLHSLNSVALAKANAFGRQNYTIERYRDSFNFLARGEGSEEDRIRQFRSDNKAYASKYLGNSIVSEIIGQLFAEKFVFMNRRDIEAAQFLGIKPVYERGDDFAKRFTKFNKALEPLLNAYQKEVKSLIDIPRGLQVDQFLSWVYEMKIPKKPAPEGTQHYWLNCNPDVWKVSEFTIGTEETFTTHNENGKKRQVYACFKAAKHGDLVIGYETAPTQQVTSLLEIAQGVHEEEGKGECVSVKIIEQLGVPYPLHDLQMIPALADCDPVKAESRRSLFKISKAEYDAILGKTFIENVETPELNPMKAVYTITDALDDLFIEEVTFKEWVRQWEIGKNLILQGAPGVGKTFVARRLAYALMQEEDPQRVAFVQFHQSYGYEDFVQGIKPVRVKEGDVARTEFDLRNGVFYDFCLKAKGDPRPHVFIIDEINRGNLSRILGELLMLIEVDKRGEDHTLRLAYQEEGQCFFVPDNIYILGMMNTADRSLAVVDYALRRRFRFATIEPAFENKCFSKYLSELCGEILTNHIILVMGQLNEAIASDKANLGPGFCIGHSYFCRVKNNKDYEEVIRYQIQPLINEYWFDQTRKADGWIDKLLSV